MLGEEQNPKKIWRLAWDRESKKKKRPSICLPKRNFEEHIIVMVKK